MPIPTAEHKQRLKAYCQNKKIDAIAAELNIHPRTMSFWAKRLGLSRKKVGGNRDMGIRYNNKYSSTIRQFERELIVAKRLGLIRGQDDIAHLMLSWHVEGRNGEADVST